MVNVTIGELLEEIFQNDSKIPFENPGGLTKRDNAENLANGLSVVLLKSMSDLPPEVNGFVTLEQNKSYTFINSFDITSPILFPAGWIGFIKSSFLNEFDNLYTGAGTMFNTLNIDGAITDISESMPAASVIVTSAAHGLLDGQFVNITGTTSYNKQRLVISNVTTNTFDVQLVFVASETGTFDTGFELIEIKDIGFQNAATADLFDLTGDNSGASALVTTTILAVGFLSPGIVRNAINMVFDNSGFTFFTTGITLENCDTIRLGPTQLISLVGGPGGIALTITGSITRGAIINNLTFFLSDPGEFPIRIDPTITNADQISIQNSPDNNVATDFFDTSAGGLDQTDPQVITKNNGNRLDSMSSAQVGFTNIGTPIVVAITTQDVPVLIDGTQFNVDNLERATATTAGQITNLTPRTKKYPVTFSALIEKVGGGTTDIGLLIIVNGALVLTGTFEIPHSVNTGVIQISATRDFELAENDTIELAVVNFDGTADISVSQANISYAVET